MKTISTRIVSLRKDAGLSQQQLADDLNLSRRAISLWETGRRADGGVLGEGALDVLDALGSCYHASHVHVFGHAFRGEGLEAHLH